MSVSALVVEGSGKATYRFSSLGPCHRIRRLGPPSQIPPRCSGESLGIRGLDSPVSRQPLEFEKQRQGDLYWQSSGKLTHQPYVEVPSILFLALGHRWLLDLTGRELARLHRGQERHLCQDVCLFEGIRRDGGSGRSSWRRERRWKRAWPSRRQTG